MLTDLEQTARSFFITAYSTRKSYVPLHESQFEGFRLKEANSRELVNKPMEEKSGANGGDKISRQNKKYKKTKIVI